MTQRVENGPRDSLKGNHKKWDIGVIHRFPAENSKKTRHCVILVSTTTYTFERHLLAEPRGPGLTFTLDVTHTATTELCPTEPAAAAM